MEAANKKIGAYSKGMRQRVKMAQALVHDPAAPDPRRAAVGHGPDRPAQDDPLIRDWGRAGKSIIVSSHILHEIESMTSNILLINNGRILAEGTSPDPRAHRRASAYRLRPRRRSPPHRAPVPRRHGDDVRSLKFEAGRGGRRDREARPVLRAA
jgi:ABC-2 type transport system ATP-binding protein